MSQRRLPRCASDRPSTAGLILLAVVVGGAGLRYAVVNPLRNYLLDFRAYYAAGTAMHMGLDPYDIATIRKEVVLPGKQPIAVFPYPPPTLAIMYSLAALPFPGAQTPWCLLQFTCGLAGLFILLRTFRCPLGSPTCVLIACAFLLSEPLRQLFKWGQFDMIVLGLLAGAVLAAARGRTMLSGAIIGLAAVAKITPVLYLGVFALRRDWRAFGAGLGVIALLLGCAAPLMSGPSYAHWIENLTFKVDLVEHITSPDNNSVRGFAYRALVPSAAQASEPWLDMGPTAAKGVSLIIVALIGTATLAWMIRRRRELNSAECVAASVPVVLLMSPITWPHHVVQLLVPLTMIIALALRRRRTSAIDGVWIACILLLFTFSPIRQFQLQIPSRLAHLFGPTELYAIALCWLFILVRYIPLKRSALATDEDVALRASRSATAKTALVAAGAPLPSGGHTAGAFARGGATCIAGAPTR